MPTHRLARWIAAATARRRAAPWWRPRICALRSSRRQRGASLVEFALVLPILIVLIIGGIDALQLVTSHYLVAWATREAAHQAALDGGASTQAEQLAAVILENGITDATYATVAVACPASCARYQPITVTIRYTASVWVPLGPFNTIQIVRTATRASERDGAAAQTAEPASDAGAPSPVRRAAAPVPGGAPVPGSKAANEAQP